MTEFFELASSGAFRLVAFILVLGVLVFVHELGHFAVAKWADIKVEEFGFGFPPKMLTLFKKGETEYTLNWLPVGGFVRMIGENGEEGEDPRSFAAKSKSWRTAVLLAGPIMNLLLPIFLFAFSAMVVGVPEGPPTGMVEVLAVESGSPADEAGLRIGDKIVYLANQRVLDVTQLQALVQEFEGQPIPANVARNGELIELSVEPVLLAGEEIPRIGVQIATQREKVHYNPIQALDYGLRNTWALTTGISAAFAQLIGEVATGQSEDVPVAGPLGIFQVTGEVAQTGQLDYILNFMALLSVNLAIFNLLPIPGLDGGRLLFIIIEALRGKRISAEREGLVHLLGIALLLGLMLLVTVVDVQRLLNGVSILQ